MLLVRQPWNSHSVTTRTGTSKLPFCYWRQNRRRLLQATGSYPALSYARNRLGTATYFSAVSLRVAPSPAFMPLARTISP